MAYVPSILIDLIEGSANFGNIVSDITNTTIAPAVTENVYYRVTSPSGIIIKAIDFGIPDGQLTLALPSASMPLVPLPVVTDGSFEEGTYGIDFYVELPGIPGVYVEVFMTFVLDIKNQGSDTCVKKGLIDVATDCFCLKMTITDKSDYSDVTVLSKTMTISPPVTLTDPTPTDIVTTNDVITIDFGYSGVTYNTYLFSTYNYPVTPTGGWPPITVQESLSFTQAHKVLCDFNLCKLIKCINDFFEACRIAASNVGGIQNLPFEKLDKWLYIEQLLTVYNTAIKCQDAVMLEKIFRTLQELVDCDCGCDGEGSDQVVKLVPLCTPTTVIVGAENGLSTVSGPSGLLVVLGGTLYGGLTTIEGGITSELQIGSGGAPLGFLSTTTDNAQGAGTTTFNASDDIKLNNTTANTSISVTDTNSGAESGVEIKTLKVVGATANINDVLTLVNATTGEAEFSPVVAGKYVTNFLAADFTGVGQNYTLTAATHGKGINPIVQIYDTANRFIRTPGPFIAYASTLYGEPFAIGVQWQIVADNPGVVGNSISIVTDGINTLDYWVNQWNIGNPTNTATLTYTLGSGYVGGAFTYNLSGGASYITTIKIQANGDIIVATGGLGFDGTIIVI